MIVDDSKTVDIPTSSGPMRSLVSLPSAPGRYPGIVLFSEIFQITGPVRRIAAALASNGFVVVTPEIYHEYVPAGTVISYDAEGAAHGNSLKTEKPLQNYDNDARAALQFLGSHESCTGVLGTMGICIGGHLAFRAAMNHEVRAAACFYATDIHKSGLGAGSNDDSLARVSDISGELLMVWGRQDPHISREGRALIYNTLADTERNFQWHEFNAAHAFLRDEGPRYDAVTAKICMDMTVELFTRRLAEGDQL